jgi:site-specific DNA-cytosine methylase
MLPTLHFRQGLPRKFLYESLEIIPQLALDIEFMDTMAWGVAEHVLSIDIAESRRKFIKGNFPDLLHLYGCVWEVATGQAHNYITGAVEKVPAFDVLVAGPSCKDLSSENPKRTFSASSRSGSTFAAVLAITSRFKPMLAIFENVLGLVRRIKKREKPVLWVLAELKRIRYAAGYKVLDSLRFAMPQRRNRVYLWAYRGNPPFALGAENWGAASSIKSAQAVIQFNIPLT